MITQQAQKLMSAIDSMPQGEFEELDEIVRAMAVALRALTVRHSGDTGEVLDLFINTFKGRT